MGCAGVGPFLTCEPSGPRLYLRHVRVNPAVALGVALEDVLEQGGALLQWRHPPGFLDAPMRPPFPTWSAAPRSAHRRSAGRSGPGSDPSIPGPSDPSWRGTDPLRPTAAFPAWPWHCLFPRERSSAWRVVRASSQQTQDLTRVRNHQTSQPRPDGADEPNHRARPPQVPPHLLKRAGAEPSAYASDAPVPSPNHAQRCCHPASSIRDSHS